MNHALVQARTHALLSQAQVAEKVGVSKSTLNRWEQGKVFPYALHRRKLCALFGKTEEELGFIPQFYPQTADVLPDLPQTPLVGRDKELAQLKARLLAGRNVTLTALNGLPGVGKTALAVALVHDPAIRAHFKGGILWAGLGPDPHLQGHLSRWGTLLGMSRTETSGLKETEEWAVALRRSIGSRTMLLVIDDAWKLEDVLTLKVGGPNCVYLVSTRFPSLATQVTTQGAMTIRELNSEDGMTLLRTLASQVVGKELERARDLVMAVGGLPLALHLMGNYLRTQSSTGQVRRISAALQRLTDASERLNVGEPRGPGERHPSLTHDTHISLRTVIAVTDQQLSKQASQTLSALSVFPPKPNSFSEEAACAVAGCTIETLDELSDAGLLESSGSDRYTLHQTIADYARQERTPDSASARLITYMTELVENHRKEYEILEIESENILAALEAASEQAKYAELTRAACAYTSFLLSRSLYQIAEVHLQRANLEALARSDSHDLASTLLSLGEIAQKQGRYEQAATSFQQGLEYARQVGDEERVSAHLAHLGWVCWQRGELDQAEAYLQEGLALTQQFGSQEHMCSMLRVLGSVANSQGNYAQAVAYLQDGIVLAQQTGDREQHCLLLLDLGVTLVIRGEPGQGEQALREALSLARQLRHQDWICLSLLDLGDTLIVQEKYAQAKEVCLEGLAIAQQIHHQEFRAGHLFNIGMALYKGKSDQSQEAESYLQEGLVALRQFGRPELTAEALYVYGNFALEQGRLEQAEAVFQEMLTFIPEKGNNLLMRAWYGLARVAAMRGDIQQARSYGTASREALSEAGHHLAKEVTEWLETLH